MPVHVRDEGQYEHFETTKGNEILVLNGEKWYSVVAGQAGEIIVLTDADHEKRRTLQKGRFYLADFEEDPQFKDMPHLFLEANGAYEEAILPQALPTPGDKRKKIIRTEEKLPKEELENYLRHPAPAGPGEKRMGRPDGGSISNVAHHLSGIDLPASRDEIIAYARKKNAPRAVIDQLEEMPGGQYQTMADVTKAIGEGKEPLPIENYDALSASEIQDRLGELDEDALRRLKEYEQETLGRKTILRTIDEKLDLSGKDLPIDGYERMKADEIADRLDALGEEELSRLKEYEKRHRGRKTVLEAIEHQQGA